MKLSLRVIPSLRSAPPCLLVRLLAHAVVAARHQAHRGGAKGAVALDQVGIWGDRERRGGGHARGGAFGHVLAQQTLVHNSCRFVAAQILCPRHARAVLYWRCFACLHMCILIRVHGIRHPVTPTCSSCSLLPRMTERRTVHVLLGDHPPAAKENAGG